VRFDGGHKKDEFLTSHFGRCVEWVPVCPEFEIGLGVPRESLRLVAEGKNARHKFLLMAHQQAGMRRLGNLVAQAGRSLSTKQLGAEYFDAFCKVMRHTPTRRDHTNVLQHLAGYFSEQLIPDDRVELSEIIDRYHREHLPLMVPLTWIRHYVRKHNVEYLMDQIYLDPHPDELNLLNQI
jgi:uncharacterized protein YbgA (DUF1722 family)